MCGASITCGGLLVRVGRGSAPYYAGRTDGCGVPVVRASPVMHGTARLPHWATPLQPVHTSTEKEAAGVAGAPLSVGGEGDELFWGAAIVRIKDATIWAAAADVYDRRRCAIGRAPERTSSSMPLQHT
eukprot:CAMPEP_0194337808 /NCGR_PEP_ID=MMETSP0171-20130528/77383_1 /TAXON_ID=218684 /ORGANISM="Corethron pennatum, Strain L29A3" /LENGTH=127 /DNA_ID=CAMNT_0039101707 /DNA_START=81 /DNA_END=465 /DNA_ORIENTATION=+